MDWPSLVGELVTLSIFPASSEAPKLDTLSTGGSSKSPPGPVRHSCGCSPVFSPGKGRLWWFSTIRALSRLCFCFWVFLTLAHRYFISSSYF